MSGRNLADGRWMDGEFQAVRGGGKAPLSLKSCIVAVRLQLHSLILCPTGTSGALRRRGRSRPSRGWRGTTTTPISKSVTSASSSTGATNTSYSRSVTCTSNSTGVHDTSHSVGATNTSHSSGATQNGCHQHVLQFRFCTGGVPNTSYRRHLVTVTLHMRTPHMPRIRKPNQTFLLTAR